MAMNAKEMIMRPRLDVLLFEMGLHQSYTKVKTGLVKTCPERFVAGWFQFPIDQTRISWKSLKILDQELIMDIPHGIHEDVI